jgi:hypothetical protein
MAILELLLQRESTTALTFNEERELGILPRAALHQENVISNEQLNRQRVEAGQSAPIFAVSACSTLCRFLREVACFRVN